MTEYTLHTAPLNSSFVFHNSNEEVGRFSFKDGVMTFTGNADEAARQFLDFVKKQYAGPPAALWLLRPAAWWARAAMCRAARRPPPSGAFAALAPGCC